MRMGVDDIEYQGETRGRTKVQKDLNRANQIQMEIAKGEAAHGRNLRVANYLGSETSPVRHSQGHNGM